MRWLALLAAVCLGLRAVVIEDVGPFTVRFYNAGEVPAYGDGASVQTWTQEQIDDVAFAIGQWDAGITNTPGRQITLDVLWQELGTDGGDEYILGGSFSPSYGDGTTSWNYGEHVWRDGATVTGAWSGYDTRIVYDITAGTVAWNFGADAPTAGEIDFRSVVTHELGHSLGFVDTYDYRADDWGNAWGTVDSPYAWAGYRGLSAWDTHLVDSDDRRPVSGQHWPPKPDFDETDNPVYWDGAYAMAAYGGNQVPIYAPITYEPGSSLSHLDQSTFAGLALMTPAIYTGVSFRSPSALEWAMMRDMGWDIVPEPRSLALLAVAAGVGLRRQRRGTASRRRPPGADAAALPVPG